jgi:Heterokaryon incompatibility protein (HET)
MEYAFSFVSAVSRAAQPLTSIIFDSLEIFNRDLYPPLDSSRHQIRLLRLRLRRYAIAKAKCQPGKPTPIHLELIKCSADDNPAYLATSYVWGKDYDPNPIFVNGHNMKVTIALRQLLESLFDKFLLDHGVPDDDSYATVWIDAICS